MTRFAHLTFYLFFALSFPLKLESLCGPSMVNYQGKYIVPYTFVEFKENWWFSFCIFGPDLIRYFNHWYLPIRYNWITCYVICQVRRFIHGSHGTMFLYFDRCRWNRNKPRCSTWSGRWYQKLWQGVHVFRWSWQNIETAAERGMCATMLISRHPVSLLWRTGRDVTLPWTFRGINVDTFKNAMYAVYFNVENVFLSRNLLSIMAQQR